jgi:hypothetical protein
MAMCRSALRFLDRPTTTLTFDYNGTRAPLKRKDKHNIKGMEVVVAGQPWPAVDILAAAVTHSAKR